MAKVALYDPYLDVLGGGEKHILSIMEVFGERGFGVDIFWNENLGSKIKERFDLSVNNMAFLPNIFQDRKTGAIAKFQQLGKYDYFFYVTDGSYFFSGAKKNYIFSMVPKRELYSLNPINRLKLINFDFIANSKFTQKNLRRWGLDSQVIYPYINDELSKNTIKKEKIVLSVGRFFYQLHSKKQKLVVQSFKRLNRIEAFKDFKLILAGGLKTEDKGYLDELRKLIGENEQIELKANITYKELIDLYKKSLFYWHFTGYGLDDKKEPEAVEHLGISPLEAMFSGGIVFCYNAGGPKEFINDARNGFLFDDEDELIDKMGKIIHDDDLQKTICGNAKQTVADFFSKKIFRQKVISYFGI